MAPPESVLIGLGSNLGDRASSIARAVEALRETPGIREVRVSPLIETEPWGNPSQGALGGCYLNGAAEVRTDLPPAEILRICQAIEETLGRRRTYPNAPRPIDLDILLFGDRRIDEPGLVIPHPRMLERGFVLEPLSAIAPDRRHPITGRTLGEHFEEWSRRRDRDR